jgi:hypothetical protein
MGTSIKITKKQKKADKEKYEGKVVDRKGDGASLIACFRNYQVVLAAI